MLAKSAALQYYKRKEIQEEMITAALHREAAIRYGDKGFGKRPDILTYPNEILDLAQKGSTSFHASEELWSNPTLLQTGMSKADMRKLGIGWDLIIDIDAPVWSISKITAWLVVRALKDFGISSVSIKFSGNKGFHIGVPFEAFPRVIKGKETKDLFPHAPRAIAKILLNHMSEQYIGVEDRHIIFGKGMERRFRVSFEKLKEAVGKEREEMVTRKCMQCHMIIKGNALASSEFVCPRCEAKAKGEAEYQTCPRCNILMQKVESGKKLCACNTMEFQSDFFDPLSVIDVDTILISSRHLFRMPYSLHEKSGLVSLPFNANKVLLFEKKFALPEIVRPSKHRFLDRNTVHPGEAGLLLDKALSLLEEKEEDQKDQKYEEISEAIPETLFPPSIKRILEGMEDGKKRALFILVNFLECVGWKDEDIEKRIDEWNKKNPESLRQTIIVGHLRYKKASKAKVLPPNYEKDYYKGIGINPTEEEMRYKNPVRYAQMMVKRLGKSPKKAKRQEKSDEIQN